MNAWRQHWFGPVAAIRPYLLQKCLLLMVALDLLVLMIERGARYGLDPLRFNVPHFAWLQPLHLLLFPQGVPTATYYVCVLVITSFLAWMLLLLGHRRWLMAVVTVLYTYAWSMSRLDSYLHHYMISLALSCLVFCPAVDARVLRESLVTKKRKPGQMTSERSWTLRALTLAGLAIAYRALLSQFISLSDSWRWATMFVFVIIVACLVARWTDRRRDEPAPLISAWAFRLLGTTVGVIYVFTSIAKMDAEWCGGHTLRQVGSTAEVLRPMEQLAASVGIAGDWFWAALATMVIPFELLLAASYLFAVRQDEPGRARLRQWSFGAWLLANGLHLNNEMMNLIIQWFGYYMLLFAILFLLPARYLMTLGCVFYCPEAAIRERYQKWVSSLTAGQATGMLGLVSFFALFVLILSGFFTWVIGARVASCILAAGLVLVLIAGMIAGWERRSLEISLASAAAGVLMIAAVAQSSLRFDYFDLRGKTLQQLGLHERAVAEMQDALIFPPPSARAAAEVHTNLGLSFRRLGDPGRAEQSYQEAIRLDPGAFLAHYSMGNLLTETQRYDEAERHYRQAVAIKADFSDAYVNLGSLLEYQGRVQEAIPCYRQALAIEPQALDVRQLLEAAEAK